MNETFSAFKAAYLAATEEQKNEILHDVLELIGGYWVTENVAYVHPFVED